MLVNDIAHYRGSGHVSGLFDSDFWGGLWRRARDEAENLLEGLRDPVPTGRPEGSPVVFQGPVDQAPQRPATPSVLAPPDMASNGAAGAGGGGVPTWLLVGGAAAAAWFFFLR